MDRGRGAGPERDFRWRGTEVSRLEGLSDGVFALALAMVLLSGNAPTRISELRNVFEQIVPLLASFAIIGMIWHANYLFFRRYGMRDGWSAFLNAVLLFLVLLFAFPLRLLFAMVSEGLFGIGAPLPHAAAPNPLREMADADFPILQVYAAGFGAIYCVVLLLYRHAWSCRDELGLDALERAITRHYQRIAWIMIAFALVSIALATLVPTRRDLAGWIFFGIGPVMAVHGWRAGVERERIRRGAPVA